MSKRRKHSRRRQPQEGPGPGNGANAILQDIRAGQELLRIAGITPSRETRGFRDEV